MNLHLQRDDPGKSKTADKIQCCSRWLHQIPVMESWVIKCKILADLMEVLTIYHANITSNVQSLVRHGFDFS